MSDKKLHIGFSRKGNKNIEIPINSLKRHFAALGSSGSGKTVLVKAIMEEAIRAGVPLLLVDLQGDLASLALDGDKKLAEKKGTPGKYYDEINRKKQVAIYTPASSKGISISMNPLKAPPEGMEREDEVQAIDAVADTIANILGYNTDKGKGAEVKSYLYLLLQAIWKKGEEVSRFDKLANYILNDADYLDEAELAMIKDKIKEQLAREIKQLTIGSDSLIFNLGIPLDVETMMNWADEGRTPVNVLYLNTLRKQSDKVNFIADTATQVYNYMLKNPKEYVQLIFVLDELAGLVPPIRAPPSKKPIQLLLKQGRKYGISLLLATQNISDVDYKSLGQVGTWALGRLMARQDIEKVKDIVASISPTEVNDILSNISKQKTGEFMLLAPDIFESVQRMKVRWLVTDHVTMDEKAVMKETDRSGIRLKFPEAKGPTRRKGEEKVEDELEAEEAMLEEIEYEEEIPEEEGDLDEITIPAVSSQRDIEKALNANPIVVTAEDLANITDESIGKIRKNLDNLVTKKKAKSAEMDEVTYYYGSKHKMDPKHNIIGPMFRVHNEVAEGEAYDIIEDNLKKVFRKKIEKILEKNTKMNYLPLWKIGVTKREKIGLFKKKTVMVKSFYFVNGNTGGILHYDKDEKTLEFPFRIKEPDDIISFKGNQIDTRSISLKLLKDDDLRPLLSRKHALDQIVKKLGYRVDYKIVPSIVWYPYWQFTIKDNDKNTKRKAWVDGVYGYYSTNNPLEDE